MMRMGWYSAAIVFGVVACARSTMVPPASPMPSSNASELTRDEQARHVLNRLAFGPRPGEVARVASMGVDRWIAWQLSPATVGDADAEHAISSLETQRKLPFELLADHPDPQEITQRLAAMRRAEDGVTPVSRVTPSPDNSLLRRAQQTAQQLTAQITAARALRAVASERQLQEVMTDFWENHFSVFIGKSPNRYSMVEYDRDVIRPRALGKFRDLLGAVAKSPQMLFYLDNIQSGVDSLHPNVAEQRIEARRQMSDADPVARALSTLPRRRARGLNENYARELLELHTLGVDGGYTQKDVQEVARALTGWTLDSPQVGGSFVFRPELHDAGEKVVLGQTLPAGRGIEDGEAVFDLLSRAPATAKFITTKLARRFVSDDPPPALVARCASAFTKSDGDIAATMRCIVTSPEFFSRSAYRAKVKTPFELVTSMVRALGAVPDTSPRVAQMVNQLGQPIYGRLTPDGWPERGDAWMNSGAILNRINLGFRVASGQVPSVKLAAWPAAARLNDLPREAQVDGVIEELLGSVSPETRRILMTGENPILTGEVKGPQLRGLAEIVGLALGTPEFQRR
jgi:uncharacterized protein (DUF1800 family)